MGKFFLREKRFKIYQLFANFYLLFEYTNLKEGERRMKENYLAIGEAKERIESYKIKLENGDIVPDMESQVIVKRKLYAYLKFLEENKLLKKKVLPEPDWMLQKFYKNDLTEDGLELIRRKEGNWLSSKGSKKNPPVMTILEKELKKIREGK